jgi:hypothetical protein
MFCVGPVRGEPGSGIYSSRVHPPRINLADVWTVIYFFLFSFCAIKANLNGRLVFYYAVCRLLSFPSFSGTLPGGSQLFNREPEA